MHITRTKVGLVSAVVVAAAALPLGSSLASGATAAPKTAAGAISVFVTSTNAAESVPDKVLITGAFSDHGISPNGDTKTALLKLTKGVITLNVAKFNAVTNSKNFGTFNATSCSFTGTARAPVTFVKGTGAYVGIKGIIPISGFIAEQVGRLPSGKCNMANNAPVVGFDFIVIGAGKVSF